MASIQEPPRSIKSPVPERSLIQRREALVKANRIRTKRAHLKRDLKAGRASIYDILLDPPDWVETMKVFDALLACPQYGKVRATKILKLCKVSPAKTLGGMSSRQRAEVASMLTRRQGTQV